MIDSHAHLHFPDFDSDRAAVLTRAFALGVTAIVEVNVSPASWPQVARIAAADPRLFASLGIHPHDATPAATRELAQLAPALAQPAPEGMPARIVAIGETGLDTVRSRSGHEDQRALFVAHVGLARETGLPLVIHCREAFPPLLELLDREGRGEVTGVFHCFSGGLEEARAVIRRGFRLGLGGAVTYALERWEAVLAQIPHEAILLETDCPYLQPDPQRHARNEPAQLFTIAAAIAPLLGLDARALEDQADRNAVGLFRLTLPTRAGEAAEA
jgi:TatD DNase family protein